MQEKRPVFAQRDLYMHMKRDLKAVGWNKAKVTMYNPRKEIDTYEKIPMYVIERGPFVWQDTSG